MLASLSRLFQHATTCIVALQVLAIVLYCGRVTPELLAPACFLGLLLLVMWLLRLLFSPTASAQLKQSPLHAPVLAFLAYALVRYFTSPIEYEARIEVFQIVLCVAVYFVCANEF